MNGEVLDFGTTGFLHFSNLVMYDRQTESWWQEFSGEAIVGEMTGQRLEILPNAIVSWLDFKDAHPDGLVLSRDTGAQRLYGLSPYAGYEAGGRPVMYQGPPYFGLPAMERVAAIELGDEALAVPFSVLVVEPVVHFTLSGQDLVVFLKKGTASMFSTPDIWTGRDVGSIGVFDPNVDGKRLSIFAREDGEIADRETGSTWSLLGRATSGPLEGSVLTPIVHRAQFWFSWQIYRPDTLVYEGDGVANPVER